MEDHDINQSYARYGLQHLLCKQTDLIPDIGMLIARYCLGPSDIDPVPGQEANLQTVLEHLQRCGSLEHDGKWNSIALRVLNNRIPWICRVDGSKLFCWYPAGIDTVNSWGIFFNEISQQWILNEFPPHIRFLL